MRTDEGFLTSLEPVPRLGGCLHRIHTFNPGRNDHQVSILRLINPGEEAVRVHIRGTDDTGAPSSGTASLTVLPGTARHLTSQELESGEADGLEGALGEGTGKWRLNVASDGAIQVMNLLASPTGHLASFSAEGVSGDVNIEGRVASLRQHGDNIIVAEIRGCVNRSEIDFAHVAKAVVARYGDEFDFIFMTSNLDSIRENQRYGYHGRYFRVQNQVEGIGVSTGPYAIFAQIYGGRTQGRLKGLIHFTYRDGILWGPGLHEIMHAWANYIIDVGSRVGAHWGFSSANGQLGGFAIENLVDRGNDEYTAGRFGTFANGGNSVPYSPIELYLAGWVGPAEVPDLWLGKNAHWVIEGGKFKQNEKGEFVFRAPEVEIWSIERIIAQHGARRPDHRSAQRSFRGAYVLLVDATSPGEPEQLDMLGRQLEAFTRAGDDGLPNRYNFWEGTGGRASLRLDGLGELKGAATAGEPRIAVPARPNAGENLGEEDHEHHHWNEYEDGEVGPDGEDMWMTRRR